MPDHRADAMYFGGREAKADRARQLQAGAAKGLDGVLLLSILYKRPSRKSCDGQ